MGPNQSALFKGRDHVTIWRWVQRYAPEMNRRCRRELRRTNGSWREDETYLRVAGNRVTHVRGDQCGWKVILSEGYRRAEEDRCTRVFDTVSGFEGRLGA
jgi:hypothetical protein